MQQPSGRIHLTRRGVEDLSDDEINRLASFGRQEAELISGLIAATRAGDRELVWTMMQQFCEIEDAIEEMAEKKEVSIGGAASVAAKPQTRRAWNLQE
jgi:hypothetical protein